MQAIWSLLQLLNSAIVVRKNHRQYINKWADCITRKLYLQKQEVGWSWPDPLVPDLVSKVVSQGVWFINCETTFMCILELSKCIIGYKKVASYCWREKLQITTNECLD